MRKPTARKMVCAVRIWIAFRLRAGVLNSKCVRYTMDIIETDIYERQLVQAKSPALRRPSAVPYMQSRRDHFK